MRYELIGLRMHVERRRSKGVGPVQAGLLLAALLVIAAITVWSMNPPEPRDAAGVGEFSAQRALEDIAAITAYGPHPTGSHANELVKDYLIQRLESLGYKPEVHREFVTKASWNRDVLVKNIVAKLDGEQPGPALMITAHYDSVHSGPGAMDDGAGIAVLLQIAEAMAHRKVRNPVIFLLSDGEELSLLGATAFVTYSPLAEQVAVVLNLESRGSSGLALLFETGQGNRELVKLYADVVDRPAASSAYCSFYEQLPNSTDFTVYKEVGMTGYNLANIGTPQHYHTFLDNLDNVDVRTLQHLGDTAMALALGLADADLEGMKADEDSVFFDLFTRVLVHYPQGLALPLAIVVLAISLVAWSRLGAVQPDRPGLNLVVGCVAFVVSSAAAIGCALGIISLIRPSLPVVLESGIVEQSIAASVAIVSAAAVGVTAVLALIRRWAGIAGLWGGALIWWNAAVVACTIYLPGMSHLFLFPAAACALGLLLLTFLDPASSWSYLIAAIPGTVVTSVLWMPYVGMFSQMGGTLMFLPAVPVALLASIAGPLFVEQRGLAKWAPTVISLVVALVATGITFWTA
ncbi:MAG: M28 family peptidase [Bacillota bacterium]